MSFRSHLTRLAPLRRLGLAAAVTLAATVPGARTHAQSDSSVSAPTTAATAAAVRPPALEREFRGAWVTPLWAGGTPDWPSAPGLSPDSQRAELRALMDEAQALGLNALILHVRTAADALYPTPLAPWSAFLTGRSGESPGYDPLAFAVSEAHARGLQLHAWFNPFRAMLPNFAGAAAPSHVTRAHPEWIRRYGTQTWIDPGEPKARAAVLATIVDVVRRYDIDGVHIDDYFYPYREKETVTRVVGRKHHRHRVSIRREIEFPDGRTWRRYGAGRFETRAAWRRANIDDFVKRMYAEVKQTKPWVLVGVSPFGIWRSGVPAGITGLDAYGEIYADARRWLTEGWVDYLAPQLYWPLDGAQSRFTRLDEWWRGQNPRGRHIWPGLNTTQAVPQSAARDPWPLAAIPAEIDWLRQSRSGSPESPGHVHFRLGSLRADWTALGDTLRADTYARPALVPASPWLGGRPPAAPNVVRAGDDSIVVTAGDSVTVVWWAVQTRAAGGAWTTRLVRAAGDSLALPLAALGGADATHVAITALDRAGQQGRGVLLARPLIEGGEWVVTTTLGDEAEH